MQTETNATAVHLKAVPWRAVFLFMTLAAGLTLLTFRMFGDRVGNDFMCFWTAGRLLASGQDPYDPALQKAVQHGLGWDPQEVGLGLFDFLPMNYPLWVAPLSVPLLPLGYVAAKVAWVAVGFFLVICAAYCCRDLMPRVRPELLVLGTILFIPVYLAVAHGQSTPIVLFLFAVAWRLLRVGGHDALAGAVLAWATLKPQLSGLLVLGLCLWSLRQGRLAFVKGFALMFGVLLLVTTAYMPHWITEWITAVRNSPMPAGLSAGYASASGAAWANVLRTFGLSGPVLYASYLALAIPALLLILWSAWRKSGSVGDVFVTSALAVFFLSPYARHYDYAILLLPLLGLGSGRFLAFVISIVWVYLSMSGYLNTAPWVPGTPNKLYTIFFLPLLLAIPVVASLVRRSSAVVIATEPADTSGRVGMAHRVARFAPVE